MDYLSHPAMGPLTGMVEVPGDKSLSHRAVLFAALAEGTSHLSGVLDSADVRATIDAVRALGAEVAVTERHARLDIKVTGWGDRGPRTPENPIECGNSGTTARLLLGVLAGWDVEVTLMGDASLSVRPMDRVTAPLSSMGARFTTSDGTLPVTVRGGGLRSIAYESPVASAQVKTAVLLAGLRAQGRTSVRGPAASRDHTERLLPRFGVDVVAETEGHGAWLVGPVTPEATDVQIPGDPSSAAFIVAACLLVPGSSVAVKDVSINPTRVAFLDVLERMGADIMVNPSQTAASEPVGTVHVRFTPGLCAATVAPAEIPALIDEIPVLALVATQAAGITRFQDVGELRVKESDRLHAIVEGLRDLGAEVAVEEDDLLVTGPARLRGAALDSRGDHRLAMTWALAGLNAASPVSVRGFEAVDVSYPGFAADIAALTAGRDSDTPVL